MIVSFFRTVKYAILDFWRNFWLSFITITMVLFALISINSLLLLNLISNAALAAVEDKVDVSVFFKPEVNENQIYEIQSKFLAMNEVKEVKVISKEDSLSDFKAKHSNDQSILDSLEELGDNPLGVTLVIKAKDPNNFPVILQMLENPKYESLIHEKNYSEHKEVINRIGVISSRVKTVALGISILFSLIAIIIVFNTIRIAIYTHREEIRIMKLVGADNWFIKFPFVIQGVLYSLISCGILLMILYPFLKFIQPYLYDFFGSSSFNIIEYFNVNFIMIFGTQFAVSVLLNVFSSLYATRRYLRS